MMERYSLAVMPGMWNPGRRGELMTHIFLCYAHSPVTPNPFEIEYWSPSEHPHSALSDEQIKSTKSTPRAIPFSWSGYWSRFSDSRIFILESEFVEKVLYGNSVISRAVREMRLEVVALAQMSA